MICYSCESEKDSGEIVTVEQNGFRHEEWVCDDCIKHMRAVRETFMRGREIGGRDGKADNSDMR